MITLKQAAVAPILTPTSLTISAGEKVAVLGTSGAGKTTLLRLFCGWLSPTAGTITAPPVGDFSYIPQDLDGSLNPKLKIRDIIFEPVAIARGDLAAAAEQLPSLLEQLNLPNDCAERKPSELSGGQRQRVGIARALINNPQVIYADEALSALDAQARALVIELFARPELTTILVSHNLAAAELFCDRCLILDQGAIVEDLPTTKLWDLNNASPARKLLVSAHQMLAQHLPNDPSVDASEVVG